MPINTTKPITFRLTSRRARGTTTTDGAVAAAVAADRRARSDARRALFASLSVGVLQTLIFGWTVMITVGIVHLHWLPNLPTVDFRTALWVAVLIQVIRYSDPR